MNLLPQVPIFRSATMYAQSVGNLAIHQIRLNPCSAAEGLVYEVFT